MGYATKFKIRVANKDGWVNKERLEKIVTDLEEISDYDWFEIEGNCIEMQAKWSDWQKDLKKLALKHLDVQFEVDGAGEESQDIWRAFFRGTKSEVQEAEWSFPDDPDWVL